MLHKLLEKLGITNFTELSAEEQATYQEWSRILSVKEITLDDVKKLANEESRRASTELKKFDNSKERELFYKALCHLTDALVLFIETPVTQRDTLKRHLKNVFHIDI